MNKTFSANKIYVSKSKIPNSGRGVFASTKIKAGEVVESCPYIEIPKEQLESLERSVFINYVYFFGKKKNRMLIPLGFGAIYNHSYTPNAIYKIKPKEGVIEFISINNIKRAEEITVNYIQGNDKNVPLWFEK